MQAIGWHSEEDRQSVHCTLCMHYCRLKPGQVGNCLVRYNDGGVMVAASYERPVMVSVESIEKKFLFHVMPGASTLSISTAGCNFHCRYCINWRVSQRGVATTDQVYSVGSIIQRALDERVQAIAFTYTEPTIFYEYMIAIAERARAHNLPIFLKTNGYMTPEVLREMSPLVDAVNIDLKGWRAAEHRLVTGGELQPVLNNLRLAKQLGLWVEVSTLIVPKLNDTSEDWHGIAGFIARELGVDTPWHLHRFFPNFQMHRAGATPQAYLRDAVDAGRAAGLRYIYSKDLSRTNTQTACPNCGRIVIDREGFSLQSNSLIDGRCPVCSTVLAGFQTSFHISNARSMEAK